jgi:hypothetical protein
MRPSFGTSPKTLYKHDVPENCSLGGILREIYSHYVSHTTYGCIYAVKKNLHPRCLLGDAMSGLCLQCSRVRVVPFRCQVCGFLVTWRHIGWNGKLSRCDPENRDFTRSGHTTPRELLPNLGRRINRLLVLAHNIEPMLLVIYINTRQLKLSSIFNSFWN